jgi:hypothetical protein
VEEDVRHVSIGLSLVCLFATTTLLAEVPQELHYTGQLSNAAGEPVDCADPIQCVSMFNMNFRLYPSAGAETAIWEENHVAVPIYQGTFHLNLGDDTSFATTDFDGARWLGITLNGGNELAPRQKLAAAPFALRAAIAEEAENASQLGGVSAESYSPGTHFSGDFNDLANTPADLLDGDQDTLEGLVCAPGMVAKATATGWVCNNDDSGDPDTTLTEAQVDEMVANNNYSTGDHTVDTILTETEVDAMVSDNGYALSGEVFSGDYSDLTNKPALFSGSFTALSDLPAGLTDGDDDTISSLTCATDQIAKWDGVQWACADDEGGAVGTVEPAPCDASAVGQMYFDEAGNALRLCDGTEYRKIKLCTEVCPPASAVVCGLPVEDDCGSACGGLGTALNSAQCTSASTVACGVATTDDCDNACVESGTALNPDQCNAPTTACGTPMTDSCENLCGGNGVACDPGLACTNDTCTPTSCKALLDLGLSTGSGNYTIDVDGTDPIAPFQVECDMSTDGGGWTLVAIISSHDGLGATDCTLNWDREDDRWTDGSVLNEGNFFTSLDHKYLSYSTMGFSEFLMKEQVASAHGWKAWDIGSQINFAQMMQGGCTTLASTPTSSGGSISASNALIYANNLLRNCNCDYSNSDDTCRLHGNSPNNPDGNCYNGGWGLGVDGDNHCDYNSEARPQKGGWSNQCYSNHNYYSNGKVWAGGGVDHGHFVGHLYVR